MPSYVFSHKKDGKRWCNNGINNEQKQLMAHLLCFPLLSSILWPWEFIPDTEYNCTWNIIFCSPCKVIMQWSESIFLILISLLTSNEIYNILDSINISHSTPCSPFIASFTHSTLTTTTTYYVFSMYFVGDVLFCWYFLHFI